MKSFRLLFLLLISTCVVLLFVMKNNGISFFSKLVHTNASIVTKVTPTNSSSTVSVRKNIEAISTSNEQDVDSAPIRLLFVGDIMLSRAIGSRMVKEQDWTFPFLKIASTTRDADLTFGNLENPVSSRGVNVGSIYSFRADPRTLEGLLFAGFDVVSIANNHIWDYGTEAFKDTLVHLTKSGIAYAGAGLTYKEAHAPLVKEVRGTKIAYLAYTNLLPSFLNRKGDELTVAFPDEEQLTLDIQVAKKQADIVIVSFHFGDEYVTTHNASQEKIAHTAIDAGADLVVGHHPHVVQGIEKYKGVYIAYSLGNFVFDQNFSEDTSFGSMLSVIVRNKKIENVSSEKVRFTKMFQPYVTR